MFEGVLYTPLKSTSTFGRISVQILRTLTLKNLIKDEIKDSLGNSRFSEVS